MPPITSKQQKQLEKMASDYLLDGLGEMIVNQSNHTYDGLSCRGFIRYIRWSGSRGFVYGITLAGVAHAIADTSLWASGD